MNDDPLDACSDQPRDAPEDSPPQPPRPRFVIDHMLIKLGKYLRILGYDAAWDKSLRTHELIRRANAEQRVFLTCNRRLVAQYPIPDRVVLVGEHDPVKQLQSLITSLALTPTANLFSRCIRCNVELHEVVDRAQVQSRAHPRILACYPRIYTCPHCNTVFWRGSHVRNTCRRLGLPSVDDLAAALAAEGRLVQNRVSRPL